MTLEIRSDIEGKYFEAVSKDMRLGQYPLAGIGTLGRFYFVRIDKRNWFSDLEAIASFVNNELKEECEFVIG